MLDLLVREARIVDGTGAPGRHADVGVTDGRIVAIGHLSDAATRTIDAGGQVLAPGFIDIHTHYDVQVFWDPTLSPSCLHGVTTVVGGNCGFSIAPLSSEAAPYLLRMLSQVEGMPVNSLEAGAPWDWQSFAEYLDRIEGRTGVNVGFMAGHSAIRRVVMGERANSSHASEAELARMKQLLADSLRAGALGFSSTTSPTHNDLDGNPVPSRFASRQELLELAGTCRHFPGTVLEFLPNIGAFTDEDIQIMTDMSLAAGRSLNWNPYVVTPDNEAMIERQLYASDYASAAGARVVGLAMAESPKTRVSFNNSFLFANLPAWAEIFGLSKEERIAALRDPTHRELLFQSLAGVDPRRRAITEFEKYSIIHSTDPALEGQMVGDIAAREGKTAFNIVLDIAVADELDTIFQLSAIPWSDEMEARQLALWRDKRILVGASDSGAHLDGLDAFAAITSFLARLRTHGGFTMEEAVSLLTHAPAQLYGLKDRGTIREGAWADLVLFDPATIAPEPTKVRHDLPGGERRVYAGAKGISHVIVNGTVIVEQGEHTGALPGAVLRSGVDTETVPLAA